jgi:CRISPR-associated protein (TIGR03984 family)
MTETKLFIHTKPDINLPDALKQCAPVLRHEREPVRAILYSPKNCCFALLDEQGVLRDSRGVIKPDTVFEARAFSPSAELRWLREPHKIGRAALLTENESIDFGWEKEQQPVFGKIEQQYLLWGQGAAQAKIDNRWSKLATARIGVYEAPIADIEHKDYVQLITREFLRELEDGNVCVVEERLLTLKRCDYKKLEADVKGGANNG